MNATATALGHDKVRASERVRVLGGLGRIAYIYIHTYIVRGEKDKWRGDRENERKIRSDVDRTNEKKKKKQEEEERGLLWQSSNYLNGVVDLGELYRFTRCIVAILLFHNVYNAWRLYMSAYNTYNDHSRVLRLFLFSYCFYISFSILLYKSCKKSNAKKKFHLNKNRRRPYEYSKGNMLPPFHIFSSVKINRELLRCSNRSYVKS